MNKPSMPLANARQFLSPKDCIVTCDVITGECELKWQREGREVAWAIFGDCESHVVINETKTFSAASFWGEDADSLRGLGLYNRVSFYINYEGGRDNLPPPMPPGIPITRWDQ